MPAIFASDENNRGDVLEAINKVNLECKVIKCLLVDNEVWVASEQLLDTTPKYADIIPRTLDALLGARMGFYEHLRQM